MRVMGDTRRLLAGHGVKFANSFATTPLCCPSRATFLTGRYAHNHGITANEPPHGGYSAFQHQVRPASMLQVRMRGAGYRTAYVGEYLPYYGYPNMTEVPPGWDQWIALTGGGKQMYDYTLNMNGQLRRYGSAPRDYMTDVLAGHAVQLVHQAAPHHRPFFLTLATAAVHEEDPKLFGPTAHRNPRPAPRHLNRFEGRPLPHPPSFNEPNVKDKPARMREARLGHHEISALRRLYRSRLESLLSVDDAVKRLVGALKATHELQNTVIIYTSDNGYMLGEHRQTRKELAYEESAGVPLLVRGPGFPVGVRRNQVVGNIDLAPTVLDIAGKNPHRHTDGVSLRPLAQNPEAKTNRAVVIERDRQEGHPFQAVRTQRWILIHQRGGALELYDLAHDPYELRNVARERRYAERRRVLMKRVRALRRCAGKSCR